MRNYILDKYIIRKFLTTFVVCILLFTLIIVIFDVAEKLDDFLENKAPMKGIITVYYLNFIPNIINTFSPIFIFITVLYFTSRLATQSEFISILAGGVSLKRIMVPYFVVGMFLALGSYLLNAWVIPRSDKSRVRFENMYLRDYWSKAKGTIYRQLKPGTIMYMEYFNNNDSTGVGVSIERYDGQVLKNSTFSRFIRWEPKQKKWRLENVMIREFEPSGNQKIHHLKHMDTLLGFNPNDFFFKLEDVQSLNQSELSAFIKSEKQRGSENVNFLETEKHRRYASPFSTFILITIGVGVAGRKTRGGLGFSLAIGIFVIIFFLFFSKYFISMGQTGVISPWLAVWLLNIVFVPVALVFYKFAQK